ncbi:MAG: DNA-3-methyladenine glycosylase 2 family protein [Planctomycetota bacterium]
MNEQMAAAARAHLRRADARLAALIDRVGPYCPKLTRNPFLALLGSIVHQQVSMSAAATIYGRLCETCRDGRRRAAPTPNAILAVSDVRLRAAGLSRQKVRYVRNIAEAFAARRLTAARLRRMSDEEVIDAVTQLKGVGRWTAEMLLIFCLERPDVWPVDDLGVRLAVAKLLGLPTTPAAREIVTVAEAWRPYRSVATWYLWRSLERKEPPAVAT